MQKRLIVVAFAMISLAFAALVSADQTIAYPTKEKPVFSITAPDDWELTPAQEAGDFFDVSGPTGAVLSFRAIPGTDEDLNDAIADSVEFLKENYKNVKVDTPKEDGNGAYATGSGLDKENGTETVFVMAWYVLENGKIAEHWDVIEAIPAKEDWKNNNGKF